MSNIPQLKEKWRREKERENSCVIEYIVQKNIFYLDYNKHNNIESQHNIIIIIFFNDYYLLFLLLVLLASCLWSKYVYTQW